jgi:hypothetical protein
MLEGITQYHSSLLINFIYISYPEQIRFFSIMQTKMLFKHMFGTQRSFGIVSLLSFRKEEGDEVSLLSVSLFQLLNQFTDCHEIW